MAFSQKEQKIIEWAKVNGKTGVETRAAIFRLRTTGSQVDPTNPPPQQVPTDLVGPFQDSPFEGGKPEPTFREEIVEKANVRADRFGDILDRPTEPKSKERSIQAVQLFGQGAGLASDVIEGAVARTPVLKQAFEGFGKGIQFLATELQGTPLDFGDSKKLQEVVNLYDTDQDFKDTVDAVANIARLTGDVVAAKQAVNWTTNVGSKLQAIQQESAITAGVLKQAIPKTVPPATPKVVPVVVGKVDDVITKAQNLQTNIKTTLAGKNVNPQLEISAKRFAEGTGRLNDPLATYEKFLGQSKKALADIKVDPAISVVGENVGKAFGKVVKMRQGVGKVMSAELAKIGNIKANISGLVGDFAKEIGNTGRFAKGELEMLQNYSKALQELGNNPTISQIDDFLVRTNAELSLFKGKQGLTTTTNAERIVKANLAKLRQQFDPKVAGNPKLKAYSDARAQYSELTNFIQEGERHLGKLTQSGDYARDASLAKSSVQSVLNNGKKDWLLELEGLTGYQATDEAVLALQAMKDAGDFRGLSLLETFADAPAITPTGIIDKAGAFIIEKGKRAILGTPEEQTRALLQSLKNK